MPEQRKRLHCVAELALSTTFLLASEVPAIAAFARSGLLKKRNFKTCAFGYRLNDLFDLWFALRALIDRGCIRAVGCGQERGQ